MRLAIVSIVIVSVIYAALTVLKERWEHHEQEQFAEIPTDFSDFGYAGWDMAGDGGTLVIWMNTPDDERIGLFLDGRMNHESHDPTGVRYGSLFFGYPGEDDSYEYEISGEAEMSLIQRLREIADTATKDSEFILGFIADLEDTQDRNSNK